MKSFFSVFFQAFQEPFCLIKIEDVIKYAVIVKEENISGSKFYAHELIQLNKPSFVVGQIRVSKTGVLQIHDKNSNIDCIIVGKPAQLLHKSVVALFNAAVGVEEFSILENGTYKKLVMKYIIVDVKNIFVLHGSTNVATRPSNLTSIKILSKSNMYFQQISSDFNTIEKSFIAKVIFSHPSHNTNATWENFVEFSGPLAMHHAFIQEGHSYSLDTGLAKPEADLKKTDFSKFLSSLHCYFGTYQCVSLPVNSRLVDISPGKLETNFIEVKGILNGSVTSGKPLALCGVVKDLQLMTPLFASEQDFGTLSFGSETHIGVPGNKLLRILLCDSLDSTQEVWLYFSGTFKEYRYLYPLGIWPGVTVEATHVLLKTSQSTGNVYLQTTGFTCLTPMSMPLSPQTQEVPIVEQYQFLKEGLMKQGPFHVIADIICIQRVIIKSVCKGCKNNMEAGQCTYVGCHYPGGGMADIYAQILIGDGTSTAEVILKSPKHLQLLLKWREEDLQVVEQEVVKTCEKLHFYHANKIRNFRSLSQVVFHIACSKTLLCRKIKLKCRKFKEQKDKMATLYCLDLTAYVPKRDVNIFKEIKVL